MTDNSKILFDTHGRFHNYLRISITERCNLRCTYCMPSEGIELSPRENIMSFEEIYQIAKIFVEAGVDKIRITGGEPTVRKDFMFLLKQLSTLGVELGITTNGVLIHNYIEDLKQIGLKKINVSLDTLDPSKNLTITRRDNFQRVFSNILLLEKEGFRPKVNCVLIRGINDDEIANFVKLTKDLDIKLRFIEYMPFDGNKWDLSKMISQDEIIERLESQFGTQNILKLQDSPNDTTRNYKIINFKGSFGIISTVTNPFCDSCNRIRLTANGHLKNCLFSASEQDILGLHRRGEDIRPVIDKLINNKFAVRNGMEDADSFTLASNHLDNRSMIKIGG